TGTAASPAGRQWCWCTARTMPARPWPGRWRRSTTPAWCWRVRAWCARSDRAGRRLLRLRHTQAGAVVEDDLPAAVGIAPPGGAELGDRIALGIEDRALGLGQFAAGQHHH